MSEVQEHGIAFEDIKIREYTGLSKKEYDKLKPKGGYTSPFDLVEGIIVAFNGSIKSTGKSTVDCADILKRMSQTNYTLIVGCYDQRGDDKIFHTEYKFYIEEKDYDTLWGSMEYCDVENFVSFVKNIPRGRESQKNTLNERNILQEQLQCKRALMTVNPKVDSDKQRRVQCSFKLDEMIQSGIKYTKTDIDIVIHKSPPRKFKK